jgi:murein DD-endopeptidase MepM/ murein hydrolase activator NlpD
MILLFIEYRFFCRHVQELFVLKEQYAQSIVLLQKKIDGEIVQDETTIVQDTQDASENKFSDAFDEPEEMVEESSTMLDDIAAAEGSDAPDNDDEYADDSFLIINRQPDYLKQSTLDYMESQELNALMTAIDIDRWSDYTPTMLTQEQEEKRRHSSKAVQSRPASKQNNRTSKTTEKPAASSQQSQEMKKIVTSRRPMKECGLIWPIDQDKFWLSSLFGPRKRINGSWGFHHGVDMAAVKGTVVKAARAGTVTEASFQTGYGNTVVIKHSETLSTRYAHLHVIRVHNGQKVKQGMVVGTVGETGFVRKKGKDGSHLHFELYERGKRINPMQCLPRMT